MADGRGDWPGCATCPPANVRYRYLTRGTQAGQLEATRCISSDRNGWPSRIERLVSDAVGRPVRLEQTQHVYGRAQPPRTVFRAEYATQPSPASASTASASEFAAMWLPRVIARPSIVKGFEHAVSLSYNSRMQPLTVTETGLVRSVPTELLNSTDHSRDVVSICSDCRRESCIAVDGPLPEMQIRQRCTMTNRDSSVSSSIPQRIWKSDSPTTRRDASSGIPQPTLLRSARRSTSAASRAIGNAAKRGSSRARRARPSGTNRHA